MITVNGKTIEIGNFPDGTILMKHDFDGRSFASIKWRYENDREFLGLIYLVKHLRRLGYHQIDLTMPYIPNARMDRVKNDEDIFALKYFTELLNDLNLTSVTVLDPHSSVSEALINNLIVESPQRYVCQVLEKIPLYRWTTEDILSFPPTVKEKFSVTMFYPDEGAMKRYCHMINLPYAFGIKNRDWKTGAIKGLDVAGDVESIVGRDILIVDDICSRGGTFYHSAKKLKELGAKNIYLYVSHCENTILEGDLLKGDLIKKVYTTDSIFTKEHEKIEVLK